MPKFISKSLTAFLFLLLSLNVYATTNAYERQSLQLLAEMLPDYATKTTTVWPKFDARNIPVIAYFVNNDADKFLLNYKPLPAGWQKMYLDNNLIIYFAVKNDVNADAFYKTKNLPVVIVDLPSFEVKVPKFFLADEWFALFRALNLGFISQHKLIQTDLNLTVDIIDHQEENLALLYLGSMALRDYLHTNNQESLKDYVAIITLRQRHLGGNQRKWETATVIDRIYNYVINAMLLERDADLEKQLLSFWQLDYFTTQNTSKDKEALKIAAIDLLEFNDTVCGFALDKIEPRWKNLFMGKTLSASELLINQFQLTDNDIDARVKALKIKYDFAAIVNNIKTLS